MTPEIAAAWERGERDGTSLEAKAEEVGYHPQVILAGRRINDRMGKHVAQPIHSDNPRVIDYASRFQSDFMDVYLSAKCSLFISGDGGMTSL